MTMTKTGLAALAIACAVAGSATAGDAASRCAPGGRATVELRMKGAEGAEVGGLAFALDYPERVVALPSAGEDRAVTTRVTGLPDGFITAVNDTDDTLRIAIAGTEQLPSRSFGVEFDRCEGAPLPAAKDFTCTVESAAMTCGLPLENVTCEVVLK